MTKSSDNDSLDVAGLGKIAKAIPPKVYERSATSVINTFEQLVAPITELTSGVGRYLRQKFDNMVEAEKALATYTVERAVQKAEVRAKRQGLKLHPPQNSKSFVRSIEEASKETDPLLHEMWANLIASQLSSDYCHPHFVEVLSHFSPAEAKILVSLLPFSEIGDNDGLYLTANDDSFMYWQNKSGGEQHKWSISCVLLIDFRFADIAAPKRNIPPNTTILYRTALGSAFLNAVCEPQ